jgi:hypothetical protein
MKRLLLWVVVGAALVGSVSAAVVHAADPGRERVAFTAAGQAQAKAEVLRRKDVGKAWSGGARRPDLAGVHCLSYHPKQSDLVLNGAAETTWHRQAFEIDSEAQVLRTPKMVRLDWQRTVLAPEVVPCLRESIQRRLGSSVKLISFRRVAFPHVARYANAFRTTIVVQSNTGSVPVEIDLAVLGQGRNEISVTVSGPTASKAFLRRAETRLARLVARRLR